MTTDETALAERIRDLEQQLDRLDDVCRIFAGELASFGAAARLTAERLGRIVERFPESAYADALQMLIDAHGRAA